MKIVAVETEVTERPVKHRFVWRKGLPGSGTHNISTKLTIRTEDGLEGHAYAPRGPVFVDLVERRLRGILIGQDAFLKEHLLREVWEIDRIEELPLYALGVVDIALWDLNAKFARMPLDKMIGGARDSIPAYASTVTFADTAEFLDVADQCVEYGFKAIKLHAWGDPKRDAKLGQDLRNHVGPDIELMYDGSAGFDLLDAI